jgi:hypothetical protein
MGSIWGKSNDEITAFAAILARKASGSQARYCMKEGVALFH